MHARYIVKDAFYKKAKKEGFRARSAYKLEEMQQRFALIKKGDKVLDLGAAPGSWLQLESALVGEAGLVVGLDILPAAPLGASNVVVKKADIRRVDVQALLLELGIPAFDAVTSDVAPNLSGLREVDLARMQDLHEAVLRIADIGLARGGNLVVKLFFGPNFADAAAGLKARFSKVSAFKPKASRPVSDEMYLLGLGKL
jgi:23S rRNA (uridine2552-2'-O)-methyltransferase